MRKSSIQLLLNILTFSTLFAHSLQARSYKFIYEGGLHYGGDTLVKRTSDGHTLTSMGDGQLIGFGVEVKTLEKRDDLHTALSAAWLGDWTSFSSVGLLSRFPLTLTQYYSIQKWQIGAGLTYHMNHKFYAAEESGLSDIKFDNALGSTLSLTYIAWGTHMGIRATFIKYQAQDNRFPHELDGNNIGIFYKILL